MNKGFIWTAYGSNHEPLKGYRQLFALNLIDAHDRFSREYGNDSSIAYLVPDTFNQWENLKATETLAEYDFRTYKIAAQDNIENLTQTIESLKGEISNINKEIHDKYHNPRECWFDCEYGDDRNYD